MGPRMSAPEVINATENLVGALKQYFSAPIAKALLTSTLRRAKLDGEALQHDALPDVVLALERALPLYIADEGRRNECVGRLRRLLPAGSPSRPPPSRSPPAPSFSQPGDAPRGRTPSRRPAAPPAAGLGSTVVRVKTADDVANACEVGRDIARRVGFPGVDQIKIATAISELARNILLYAVTGEVRIAGVEAPRRGIEIAAVDEGPGIADLALVMSNAYRSRTGMGMGLKGAKRLMDFFDVATKPGVGTTVVARKFVA
jgi:serine/threonine-protein kinase RsbT